MKQENLEPKLKSLKENNMALTSILTQDLVNQTQTIQFFQSSTLIDQITFSSNSFTFASTSTFNLNKSDFALYIQFFNAYYNLLLLNFPNMKNFFYNPTPLSLFEFSQTNVGVTKLTYTQTSLGSGIYTINYLPSISSVGFAARTQTTISIQEIYILNLILQVYANQVAVN